MSLSTTLVAHYAPRRRVVVARWGRATHVNKRLTALDGRWGRTGTRSLRAAFEVLGFHPCYHMFEVFENQDFELWEGAFKAKSSAERRAKLAQVLEGKYVSTLDFPASLFFQDLQEMYPDAKVVLSVRDSAEQWYASAEKTIFMHGLYSLSLSRNTFSNGVWVGFGMWLCNKLTKTGRRSAGMLSELWKPVMGGTREETLANYYAWIDMVKRTVPPHRLLVFNVSQGWAPLVEFLGVPTPTEPFPFENDTATFLSDMEQKAWRGYAALARWAGLVAVLSVVVLVGVPNVRGKGIRSSHFEGRL